MSKYMNGMTVCCAAVLALSLAGCDGGGGGGGGTGPSIASEPVKVDGGLIAKAIGEGTPLSPADAPFSVDGDELTENPVTEDEKDDDFAKSDLSGATIEGWAGSVYSRSETDGKVATTVVTYTDIEAPADQAYSEYYSEADAGGRDAVQFADPDGVLTIDNSDLVGNDELFGADFSGLGTPIADDASTPEVDESMVSRPGTFHGIPGTFACASNCEITLDAAGQLSEAAGTWTFTPDEAPEGSPHMVQGVVPDAEYMNLAYWLKSTEADDGTIAYEIGTLAQGNLPGGYGRTSSVTGSASYAGPATGVYMRKTFSPDGAPTPAAAGQFTANANLTAYFGQTSEMSIGPNLLHTISGTVDTFKDSQGNLISDAWTLKLGKTEINTGDGTFAGVATGTGAAGTWSGRFEGDNTADAIPSAATGIFHGHFLNGHVAGAFGAKKK